MGYDAETDDRSKLGFWGSLLATLLLDIPNAFIALFPLEEESEDSDAYFHVGDIDEEDYMPVIFAGRRVSRVGIGLFMVLLVFIFTGMYSLF